jgi:exodeoxyribonuclease VII large subunit
MTLDDRQRALLSAMKHRIHALHGRVREAAERLERQGPAVQLARVRARVDEMSRCLTRGMETALRRRQDRLDAKAALLEAVSPQRVLQRGYSLTRVKRGGAIVRSAEQVKEGDRILTRFVDGEVESVVEDAKQQRLFE